MKGNLNLAGADFEIDFGKPLSIGLDISQEGNPNCYYSESLRIEPVKSEDFIGSLKHGGPVNHMKISITPHGNGTHTECSGHIFNNDQTIAKTMKISHFLAQLISIEPEPINNGYGISLEQIKKLKIEAGVTALVIRTLPNSPDKKTKDYSGTNPPFISQSAMASIVSWGIEHLIVDLPSVDPEVDGGQLSAHKTFWKNEFRQSNCTITELAYIPDTIKDSLYLLNLQALRVDLDVSPSNPVLFELKNK